MQCSTCGGIGWVSEADKKLPLPDALYPCTCAAREWHPEAERALLDDIRKDVQEALNILEHPVIPT